MLTCKRLLYTNLVTGLANFDKSSSNVFSFDEYLNSYDSLLMTVGVKISDIVENRGIFRNAWSVVEGGYGAIAMMAHSFTYMVVKKNWPAIETFKVCPLKNMGEIFMNSVPKNYSQLITYGPTNTAGDLIKSKQF